MLLRRIAVENVRSFLDLTELKLDGPISILIGPNGGGKTNLLDIAVTVLRRYLFSSMYLVPVPTSEEPDRHEFRVNDMLNNLLLEPHSMGKDKPQRVEVDIEVTQRDIDNMTVMKEEADQIYKRTAKNYLNSRANRAAGWDLSLVHLGDLYTYVWNGGVEAEDEASKIFLEYMRDFEMVNFLRSKFDMDSLSTPMVYLPINRSMAGFNSSIELSGFNEHEQKRQFDASFSRSTGSIVPLAIGRLAQRFRMLLEKDTGNASTDFRSDPNLIELTKALNDLGYEWDLVCTNPLRNAYDIRLKKQGSSFIVGAASSGERELLTYLFAIFALNVRDALIVVDEPELHLHPRWQKSLLRLFVRLVESTGNQFFMATHSPTFVSPESIQYVSRVFSRNQKSAVRRMVASGLPDAKHLLNIVNSQNNEGIFFADEVVLVEGLSDRIFFESILNARARAIRYVPTVEVISVGGKGLFAAYSKLLSACDVPFSIIADRDYIEQIGTPEIKKLFRVDAGEIKADVIDNPKSLDGELLVSRIDDAMKTGNWGDAQQVWQYIKSRRVQMRENLSDAERVKFESFVRDQRKDRIFLLEKGSLEDYLPLGMRSKDIGKLIDFLADDFWTKLSVGVQKELNEIAEALMPSGVLSAANQLPNQTKSRFYDRMKSRVGVMPRRI